MYEIGNLVTLKKADQYDSKTLITTEDIGEVVDIDTSGGGPRRYIVAMQDLVDAESVTPLLWLRASELNLHQL